MKQLEWVLQLQHNIRRRTKYAICFRSNPKNLHVVICDTYGSVIGSGM